MLVVLAVVLAVSIGTFMLSSFTGGSGKIYVVDESDSPIEGAEITFIKIKVYGFWNDNLETTQLKNVCNLKTKISQIQFLEEGDTVSYNRKFTSTKNTKIGVLPLGYADGLNRNLGNKFGSVYIKNQKAPIIGTICMDMTMIDLNGIDCKEGDEVIVFNHQDHVLELAKTTTTIPYEILTSISQRVRREII